MNDHEKLLLLARRLVKCDAAEECPYCPKMEWGEDKHDKNCPFAIAYSVLHEEELNHE